MAKLDGVDGSNGIAERASIGNRTVRRLIGETGRGASAPRAALGICALAAAGLALAGCAHVRATTLSSSQWQGDPPRTGSIAVYPLDPRDVPDPTYAALARDFSTELSKSGFAVKPPFHHLTDYVAFIDYAIEIGTDQPWDRYAAVIVYNVHENHKIYEENLESDGPSNDLIRVDSALFRKAASDMQHNVTGEHHVYISTQS